MNEKDLPLLKTIHRLKGNSDFEAFAGWLRQLLDRDRALLMVEEGVQLHRAQGSAATLKMIVETIEQAESVISAIEEARARTYRPGAAF